MEKTEDLYPRESILGISFFNGDLDTGIRLALQGGLCCFPSGPGLATLDLQPEYRKALQSAKLCFVDSGYLALLWKKRTGRTLNRISGFKFLSTILQYNHLPSPESTLWVMPNPREAEINKQYLQERGYPLPDDSIYVAPRYPTDNIQDPQLLQKIQDQRPSLVVINLGGNVQEPLGAWLYPQVDPSTTLLCTGAAIAFLSGIQANIPPWADRFYLGWLLRIFQNPRRFIRRYWRARRLRKILKIKAL